MFIVKTSNPFETDFMNVYVVYAVYDRLMSIYNRKWLFMIWYLGPLLNQVKMKDFPRFLNFVPVLKQLKKMEKKVEKK
jgi:hypothetical protein